MAQTRPQLIGTLTGAGVLMIEGRGVPVNYIVSIFQEMIDTGAGQAIPGLRTASGKFSNLGIADALKAIGRNTQLVLDNGEKSDVVLADKDGTFLVSGQIGEKL